MLAVSPIFQARRPRHVNAKGNVAAQGLDDVIGDRAQIRRMPNRACKPIGLASFGRAEADVLGAKADKTIIADIHRNRFVEIDAADDRVNRESALLCGDDLAAIMLAMRGTRAVERTRGRR